MTNNSSPIDPQNTQSLLDEALSALLAGKTKKYSSITSQNPVITTGRPLDINLHVLTGALSADPDALRTVLPLLNTSSPLSWEPADLKSFSKPLRQALLSSQCNVLSALLKPSALQDPLAPPAALRVAAAFGDSSAVSHVLSLGVSAPAASEAMFTAITHKKSDVAHLLIGSIDTADTARLIQAAFRRGMNDVAIATIATMSPGRPPLELVLLRTTIEAHINMAVGRLPPSADMFSRLARADQEAALSALVTEKLSSLLQSLGKNVISELHEVWSAHLLMNELSSSVSVPSAAKNPKMM